MRGPALSRQDASVSIHTKMTTKECPVCGEAMKLRSREQIDRIPGSHQTRSKRITEWVCPECDHFEEAVDES